MSIRSLLALAAGLLLSSSALADSRVLTSIKPIQQISAALLDGIDEPAVLLPPGASGSHFRAAWGRFLPLMVKFQPELILMSAGFDGHRADPLAQLQLSEQDYKWITQEVVKAAEQCCSGRVVSTLEGGYEPQALATSVAAHIGALMAE